MSGDVTDIQAGQVCSSIGKRGRLKAWNERSKCSIGGIQAIEWSLHLKTNI